MPAKKRPALRVGAGRAPGASSYSTDAPHRFSQLSCQAHSPGPNETASDLSQVALDQPFAHISVWKKVVAKAAMHALLSVEAWAERRRSRNALAALDDRMLADLGLNRTDAQAEADKLFWMR
ncbi:MAG: DUF1127 domain-containing protein [Rhodospirillales bacterium]